MTARTFIAVNKSEIIVVAANNPRANIWLSLIFSRLADYDQFFESFMNAQTYPFFELITSPK